MPLNILDLGDDILVSQIPKYLTPQEIFNFSIINKSIYQLYYHSQLSSLLFQILYNKKFTNNENNYTLNLQDKLNWQQLFELRCNPHQKVYTWGSPMNGRLGYLMSQIDQDISTRGARGRGRGGQFGLHPWSVNVPINVAEFNGHLIVDIVANGFSFIILTNSGEMWFTGHDWKQPHRQGQGPTPGPVHKKDYRPNPGALALETLGHQTEGENSSSNIGSRRSLRIHGMRGGVILPMPITRHDEGGSVDHGEGQGLTTDAPATPPPGPTGSPAAEAVPGARRRLQPSESGDNSDETDDDDGEGSESHPRFPHRSKIKETNFLSRLLLPPGNENKIVSISTGREHILALDSANHVYSWDTGCCTDVGIKMRFPGIVESAYIAKIVAGWNLSCCLMVGIGLVVWYCREPITESQYNRAEFESDAKYIIIPFTKDDIVDFAVGVDCVLYIKKSDRKLYQFKFNASDFATREQPISSDEIKNCIEPMVNFNNWRTTIEQQGVENVHFTKLNSCYTNFVVFTNHDQVLIGSRKHLVYNDEQDIEGQSPIIIDELQGKNIKTVEIGDYHFLALTNDGDILSWGLESSVCGCLGLGPADDVISEHPGDAVMDGLHSLRAMKPLKVKNPLESGKWVSIAANGWHSGGIYVPL